MFFVCLIRLVQSKVSTEQNLQSFGFAYCVPHKTERARVEVTSREALGLS